MTKIKKIKDRYETVEDNIFFGVGDAGVYEYGTTMSTHMDYREVKKAIEKVYTDNPVNSNRELEILNIKIIGKVRYK